MDKEMVIERLRAVKLREAQGLPLSSYEKSLVLLYGHLLEDIQAEKA